MKNAPGNGWQNFLRLVRFLSWYGIAVAALFLALPGVASALDGWYNELNGSARFFAILGFVAVIAVWQALSRRDCWRHRVSGKLSSSGGS